MGYRAVRAGPLLATISLAPEWPLTIAAGMLYGAWPGILRATGCARCLSAGASFPRSTMPSPTKADASSSCCPSVPFNLQNYLLA